MTVRLMRILLYITILSTLSYAIDDFSVTKKFYRFKPASNTIEIERNSESLKISDTENNILLLLTSRNESESIVSAGYSDQLNSYYGLIVKRSEDKTRSLICRTADSSFTLLENIKELILQPVLFGKSSNLLAYISNNYTLVIVDLHRNCEISRKEFAKPIYNLAAQMAKNISQLNFQTLDKTGDLNLTIHADSVQNSTFELIESKAFVQKPQTSTASAPRNFRKFLCYGDSITSGYIGTNPSGKGYVPRFAQLIATNLYSTGTEAIRVGKPGYTTHMLIRDIDRELDRYDAGYLLLHCGTNDLPGHEERALESFTHIKEMAQKALDRGMIPVLSTLIPRTSKDSNTGDFRDINEFTNRHIRDYAASAGLPIADFWNVFINHQDYDSLMSNHVHPSEAGYQLMANTWFNILPPLKPVGISASKESDNKIVLKWNSAELDIDHWEVTYGYKSGSYSRTLKVTAPDTELTILNPVINSPFPFNVYFKVKAIDKNGNQSPESEEQSSL